MKVTFISRAVEDWYYKQWESKEPSPEVIIMAYVNHHKVEGSKWKFIAAMTNEQFQKIDLQQMRLKAEEDYQSAVALKIYMVNIQERQANGRFGKKI